MERGRGAVLYVPQSYRHEVAAPLILMLHGATQNAEFSLEVLRGAADEHGFVLLAPNSLGTTWDAIRGGFGPDVARIDRVLDETFRRCRIDPSRITVAGFSDGASYALALGLVNGDLFRRVMAFSPGFVAGDSERHGRPAIFVSHGLRDRILPIARTSRRLVPALREAGHAVEYYEFDGPHWVTDDALDRGMLWLKGAEAAADG